MASPRVVFVQKFVPIYRLPFLERVKAKLEEQGIDFLLIYGKPDAFEGSKVKTAYPDWGVQVNSKIFNIRGKYLYWQNALRHLKKGDLVIVEQAAKLLDNYPLYALHRLGYIRYGYFGHGECFQSKYELPLSRWIKTKMVRHVTRWFAYTEVSRASLLEQEVDDTRITVVNNTLLPPSVIDNTTTKIPGQFAYVGGLYVDKRFDLIIDGFLYAAASHPHIELHIIGDGPLAEKIKDTCKKHKQITYHGSLYDESRNQLLASSEAILMPGLVGLVAMDSFYFSAPIITSHAGQHSPEIAYLTDGENALFDHANGDATSYGQLISKFLSDASLREKLRDGCKCSSSRFSMDNMVERFCDGVRSAFKEMCKH